MLISKPDATVAANPERAARLAAVFRNVLNGNRELRTITDARLFFEAVRNQPDSSTCLENIITSKHGLDALRLAVRADLSPQFIRDHTLPFLKYFSNDQIKILADGQLLHQILIAVIIPPTLWNALVDIPWIKTLSEQDLRVLGWLFTELLCLPSDVMVDADIVGDIQRIVDSKVFADSTSAELQQNDYKIRHFLQLRQTPGQPLPGAYAPGGRHDNDHVDFREIAIYPTSHEFLSNVRPFYRTAQEVFETPSSDRVRTHLDNIFRLTREDLLAELRNDWQITQGRRRGNRSALELKRLTSLGFACGNEWRGWKRYSLAVSCEEGLEALERRRHPDERREFLNCTRGYLKHQSFGALYAGQEIFGFAFVDRDLDALLQPRPVVILQFTDDQSFKRAVMALKTRSGVMFTVVGTPVFAVEPVLERLKSLAELPLHDKLLNVGAAPDDFRPEPRIQEAVKLLETGEETREIPLDNKKIYLDSSQRRSLINALAKAVSVIQGPPGKSWLSSTPSPFLNSDSSIGQARGNLLWAPLSPIIS